MTTSKRNLRLCNNGHKYYKSSDCPICPVCEKERKPAATFMASLAAPARRALENAGIQTLVQLFIKTQAAILALHGMGPGSMPKLRIALKTAGLSFSKN